MKVKTAGLFWIVIAATGLAASNILMKKIPELTNLTPLQVAAWRFTIAAPLLWLITWIRRPRQYPNKRSVRKLLGMGVVFASGSVLSFLALARLTSSIYIIIIYIYPSLVVIYSLLTGKSVPRLWWLGLPMTLFGLALTVFDFGSTISVDFLGFWLALANAAAMGVYTLLSASVFSAIEDRQIGTTWVVTGAMLAGFILPVFAGLNMPNSLTGWLLLFSLGIFSTLIPLLALNTGLQLLGAARGSMLMTMQPVLAVLFSTTLFGDELSLQQWIGGVLVILSVLLLHRSADRTAKHPAAGQSQSSQQPEQVSGS